MEVLEAGGGSGCEARRAWRRGCPRGVLRHAGVMRVSTKLVIHSFESQRTYKDTCLQVCMAWKWGRWPARKQGAECRRTIGARVPWRQSPPSACEYAWG